MNRHVVVVGAGPAGIASALALKDAGLSPVVLDQADQVAASWRSRYDSLRLNTWRPLLPSSRPSLPQGHTDLPQPRPGDRAHRTPCRRGGIELRLGTRVERIDRADGGWVVRTSAGELRRPPGDRRHGPRPGSRSYPTGPGVRRFEGELLHSSEYRNPRPFEGKRVLVVGPGSSGMEIAHELAEGGRGKGLARGPHPAQHPSAPGARGPCRAT